VKTTICISADLVEGSREKWQDFFKRVPLKEVIDQLFQQPERIEITDLTFGKSRYSWEKADG
jgi:hypothetical protein